MSLEIAMTGLRAANKELTVTSNNIANTATVGFKKAEVNFGDVYLDGGSGKQLPMGVKIVSATQNFSQGDLRTTDKQMDLAIIGEGFFRLSSNGTTTYSRAGSFGVDRDGFIVNKSGHRLTGFVPDESGVVISQLQELQIDAAYAPPKQTGSMEMNMNLHTSPEPLANPTFDKADPGSYSYSNATTIFDSLGESHLATMYFRKSAPNTWVVHTFVGDQEVRPPAGDVMEFSEDGSLLSVNGDVSALVTTNDFTPKAGAAEMNFNISFRDVTQYDGKTGINALTQDGYPAGRLTGLQIDEEGFIFGRYTNDQLKVHGQIVLTNFRNPAGLANADDTSWWKTLASGEAVNERPGSGTMGLIQSGALEGSNVDITEELVSIIGSQRNYQANAQVISATDTMTQTIMNIRR
ncbi:MAG: flagellar hook protein FlgE [Pseudomonadota bacterium]